MLNDDTNNNNADAAVYFFSWSVEKKGMRTFLCCCFLILMATACRKSTSHSYIGNWKLVKRSWGFGPSGGEIVPPYDSLVVLQLKADRSYIYTSNGVVKAAGTYDIKNMAPNDEIGIVQSLPVAVQETPYHIFFSHDSLTIASLPNPGGFTIDFYLHD